MDLLLWPLGMMKEKSAYITYRPLFRPLMSQQHLKNKLRQARRIRRRRRRPLPRSNLVAPRLANFDINLKGTHWSGALMHLVGWLPEDVMLSSGFMLQQMRTAPPS